MIDHSHGPINYEQVVTNIIQRVRSLGFHSPDEIMGQIEGDHENITDEEVFAIAMVEQLKWSRQSGGGNQGDDRLLNLKEIGGYRLQKLIAQGGMGVVYQANQESLDRLIAVKILTRIDGDKGFKERFHREAKTTAKLNHPNLVAAFDYGVEDGAAWLVMPYVDGTSLDKVVKAPESYPFVPEKPLDRAKWVAAIGAQVSDALVHAHDTGVVHRDIKPANLILDDNGNVMVTDFGLAKIRGENDCLSLQGDIIGTPSYMAPEQIRGIADERSDIYSLGVTLWELTNLKGALTEDGVDSESNPRMPVGLTKIIDRACQFNPDKRFQTAEELRYALNRFVHSRETDDRRWHGSQRRIWLKLALPTLALLTCFALLGNNLIQWGTGNLHETVKSGGPETIASDSTDKRSKSVHLPDLGTGQQSQANFFKTRSISVRLDRKIDKDVHISVDHGQAAEKLIYHSVSPASKELRFIFHPDIDFEAEQQAQVDLNLQVSAYANLIHAFMFDEQLDGHELRILQRNRDRSNHEFKSLPFSNSIEIVDIASCDGETLFVLIRKGSQNEIVKVKKNAQGSFELIADSKTSILGQDAKAIATHNGQDIFVVEQFGDEMVLLCYGLDATGSLTEKRRTSGLKIANQIESLATVDGKCFSLVARGEANSSYHYCAGWFSDSKFCMEPPQKREKLTVAGAIWLEHKERFDTRTQPISIAMPRLSRGFHLKQVENGRFLDNDNQRNVRTGTTPAVWRYIYHGKSGAGNDVVHVFDPQTGTYLDEDSDASVDTATGDWGSDKLWEIIPTSSEAILLRNTKSRSYLHQLGENQNFRVDASLEPDVSCHWLAIPQ